MAVVLLVLAVIGASVFVAMVLSAAQRRHPSRTPRDSSGDVGWFYATAISSDSSSSASGSGSDCSDGGSGSGGSDCGGGDGGGGD